MEGLVITHRLDLAVRLLDTTTGKPVSGKDVLVYRNDVLIRPLEKELGILIFPALGREDFNLTIASHSYESHMRPIRFSELDARFPYVEVHLIPGAQYRSTIPCLTLAGTLPGIQSLTAIRASDTACLIRTFDPRRRLITLFNPHHLDLNRTHYALVNPDKQTFEPFSIVKQSDDHSIKIDRILETEFGNYFPISPVIFGMTSSNGSYRLRVRDDRNHARWLVCYGQDDTPHFQLVDFRNEETTQLALKEE